MGTNFVLVARVFIDMRRYQNRVTLFPRWQWNWPALLELRSASLCRQFLCVETSIKR